MQVASFLHRKSLAFTNQLLNLRSEIIKATGYKVNVHISIVFYAQVANNGKTKFWSTKAYKLDRKILTSVIQYLNSTTHKLEHEFLYKLTSWF